MPTMTDAMTPTEQSLWQLALVCTNARAGADRVVASLVRDYGRLEKVSETRLNQAVLERSQLWLFRIREEIHAGRATDTGPLTPTLDPLTCTQRGLIWLHLVQGQTPLEVSWSLGLSPEQVRLEVDLLSTGSSERDHWSVDHIRGAVEDADPAPALERIREARSVAARRQRRTTTLLVGGLLLFMIVMLFVLFDLLSWQDASETLGPGVPLSPEQTGSAP
ncbi:MAG: hypothetical protein ACNA8P_01515 [Phycisphaerales bacterium]